MADHCHKVNCKECEWHGKLADCLKAENPFAPGDEILGCPNCRAPSSMVYACDVGDCKRDVSCGTLDENREYWHTCGEHVPRHALS